MDELLPYYNRELAFFRRMASEFAADNPKVASRLRMGATSSEDPHVERLIQAFALLNARTRHKLDDDFPEISDALLDVLQPHFLAPIPSMAIVQFELDPGQSGLTDGHEVAKGTEIETEPVQGEPCRFQTAHSTRLFPINVASAEMSRVPFAAPQTRLSDQAAAVIRMRLRTFDGELSFADLEMERLRFFINGFSQYTYPLYELIFNNTLEIALASGPRDTEPVVLDANCLKSVGFEPEQSLLPYTPRSPMAYRTLTEYFAFPEKFLFFEIADLRDRLRGFGPHLDVYLYLNRSSIDLEQNVSAETFRMGCAPVVNLFRQRAEPVQTTQTRSEYHLIGDARRMTATEIYSVDRVSATSPTGEEVEFQPFYSVKHGGDLAGKTFWHASRRSTEATGEHAHGGSEIYLSLVGIDGAAELNENWYVDVETTCLNRDLPARLPFGGGQPALYASEGGPFAAIHCLTSPTPTRRPPRRQAAMWRLISHLSLGHLSIVDGEAGAAALVEILKLYDFHDSPDTRELIESIVSVSSRRAVGRVSGGVVRGTEVEMEFKSDQFSEIGLFLFATVLERFLANYCSLNSFSQLVIRQRGREDILRRWPPRSGDKVLL